MLQVNHDVKYLLPFGLMVHAYIKSPKLFVLNKSFEKRPITKIIGFYLYLKWLSCAIGSINFMKICIHDARFV